MPAVRTRSPKTFTVERSTLLRTGPCGGARSIGGLSRAMVRSRCLSAGIPPISTRRGASWRAPSEKKFSVVVRVTGASSGGRGYPVADAAPDGVHVEERAVGLFPESVRKDHLQRIVADGSPPQRSGRLPRVVVSGPCLRDGCAAGQRAVERFGGFRRCRPALLPCMPLWCVVSVDHGRGESPCMMISPFFGRTPPTPAPVFRHARQSPEVFRSLPRKPRYQRHLFAGPRFSVEPYAQFLLLRRKRRNVFRRFRFRIRSPDSWSRPRSASISQSYVCPWLVCFSANIGKYIRRNPKGGKTVVRYPYRRCRAGTACARMSIYMIKYLYCW